jgi:hypothetical protein
VPYINWKSIPPGIQHHMYDRIRARDLTEQDMIRLAQWIAANPEVPHETCCKDFGSFKLVGEGGYPKTFLTKDQPCYGKKL